jgi:SAM-dependent methyltransferase
MSRQPTCPVCGAPDAREVLRLDGVPVSPHRLCPDEVAARAHPTGVLELRHCTGCDLVWNAAFDPAQVAYGPDYENPLDPSPTFQAYAERLARRLAGWMGDAPGPVLEIGCGTGRLLEAVCALSGRRGFGVDPAAPQRARQPGVTYVREAGGWKTVAAEARCVILRHVLEHLPAAAEELEALRRRLRHPEALLYVEVPNGLGLARAGGVWELLYEHVYTFSPAALLALLSRAGFRITEWGLAFGEEFLWALAVPGSGPAAPEPAPRLGPQLAGMASRVERMLEGWRQRLETWSAGGERVVLWGAGTRGIMFANLCDPRRRLAALVDLNPRKRGRFVAGTGHSIVAPDDLPGIGPDRVLVANAVYLEEIRDLLGRLCRDAAPPLVPIGNPPA